MLSYEFDSHPEWRGSLSKTSVPLSVKYDDFLSHVLDSIIDGHRVNRELGAQLHHHGNLTGISALADMIKRARFGGNVFFNVNLHVNPTNICTLACRFCAFRRGSRSEEAYSLTAEDFVSRIDPYSDIIDEVHAVGGLHPSWTVENYCKMYQHSKNKYPHISIKSLTAVEVKHIATRSGLSILETLRILHRSGLDSIPGGGAEILVDSVRDRICRGKEKSAEYLEIHQIAHTLGIPTNCTMLFGTLETPEDRILHLHKLRNQQDASGGFQCFVPYPFLEDNSRLPEAKIASATDVIRVIAISRIMLDNIPHIKAYRMNIGDHLSAIAINSGADDIDGTVGHEEIMHDAGSTTRVDYDSNQLSTLIESAGLTPVKRNSTYSSYAIHNSTPFNQNLRLPMAGQ